ncbi:lysophospholipase [Belliella baltica DSM 15883]|uniref:Monoacylglycerol lipase n=1 Tax=Belliella baltica (strain DSM 15883 / CIP 108006 / LMG 21964 / BA134) TaxID=866536 RepID=I3Z6M4_BELBD|nr:alpha/beta hydrolase [Belliella baltica]AFL84892.1 lysophospholipase [Belliella baltica DSM 15883]
MKHFETAYTTHDNIELYLQAWMPEEPKAAVLLVHGLGEHSSRYLHFAERLVREGIAVFTFDGRGHGKSSLPKPSAYFSNYEDYLKDIDALFGKVKSYYKGLPAFIFGHSMGGGLVSKYVIDYQPDAAGVILSAAALKPADNISKILIAISSLISKLAPKLKVLKLDSKLISHDLEEVRKYDEDPLVYSDAIPARTGYELLRMMREIGEKSNQFKAPVLILHGSDDQLTNPLGSDMLYKNARVEDKTLLKYPNLYHELLNEIEKESIMNDIVNWVKERI